MSLKASGSLYLSHVFHLRLYAIQTKPVGKGNEHEHRFAQDLVPLVFRHEFDGTAVMKPVGKLDQNHSDIVVQGKKNTLEILRLHTLLLCLVFVVENSLDLGQTLDESSDLVTEKAAQVIDSISVSSTTSCRSAATIDL